MSQEELLVEIERLVAQARQLGRPKLIQLLERAHEELAGDKSEVDPATESTLSGSKKRIAQAKQG